ncbi:3'-5' exoribonuclease [Agrobacterium rubi]|nr:3'-5' exoribonuclease [Agrobacterium rubi]NTF25171.1 3'-5' exoribonuclease [Agrobacterium rubi]
MRSAITYKTLPYPSTRPRKEIMFDLETLGKRAGCAVLSIGAVAFDPYAIFDGEHQSITTGNQFFAKISLESCKQAGLFVDPGTQQWWNEQSEEAVLNAFGGTTPLEEALHGFSDWMYEVCGRNADGDALCNVWSHGEDFDQPILNHALEAIGIRKPWPYNGGRDTRTALEMGGVIYKGVSHMAVKDSMDQAMAVRQAFSNLGLSA